MPDRRETDDARLQRLADLTIEIRMMKARVQAVIDPPEERVLAAARAKSLGFRTSLGPASCPHCGYTAGLALLPSEYRRPSTLVRCFACHQDSSASAWTMTAADGPRNASERAAN